MNALHGGVAEREDAKVLKAFVREDVQVQVLPPLPLAPEQAGVYSYLLGMYLDDGYLCRMPRTYRLEVYLHRDDARVIGSVAAAISSLGPGYRVGFRRHGAAVVVTSYFKRWPVLFPQHGPGRKNRRDITRAPWQRLIVERHPEDFIRGCIDSDGCRHRRIVCGRNYPAYSFVNHSAQILNLFAEACDLLGLHHRRSNMTTISIARRADVARLDGLMARGTA